MPALCSGCSLVTDALAMAAMDDLRVGPAELGLPVDGKVWLRPVTVREFVGSAVRLATLPRASHAADPGRLDQAQRNCKQQRRRAGQRDNQADAADG